MCGITGIVAFNENGASYLNKIERSLTTLNKRGPDDSGIYTCKNIALGHSRLSIIDTSPAAAQPFTDPSGRYTIILNGEFFNFKEHRKALENKGVVFKSQGDTEVLLHLYIQEGPQCLEKVNGFFSLAIFDKEKESVFIARDRMGIKPLLYFQDDDKFIFASEMKALLAFDIPKEIDNVSLLTYLQLNYIPAPYSIFRKVRKVLPGTYLIIQTGTVTSHTYYQVPHPEKNDCKLTYQEAQRKMKELLEESVKLRLVSDVPLGAFLSGGIDSSIIVALASRNVAELNTFSIGFKDEPLFDETHYAQLVATKFKTNHTVFSLSNEDLFANLHDVLDYIDEPFADSSALAVYILSRETRMHVKVALSGDGADEMFAGYNKHKAEFQVRSGGSVANVLKRFLPLWEILPKSRNSQLGNKIRQFKKFAEGMNLSPQERYWRWAGYMNDKSAGELLKGTDANSIAEFNARKDSLLKNIREDGDMNDFLFTDMNLVLQNDMLTKVDMMSMANGLEVRVPFLDYHVVDFAFSLPVDYKIDQTTRKKILKDAFRADLPEELYHRGKQGFEVPLLTWFRTELKSLITEELLSDKFIEEQGIFSVPAVRELKNKLFSGNIDDAVAQVWGLIVFQYWWKKVMR